MNICIINILIIHNHYLFNIKYSITSIFIYIGVYVIHLQYTFQINIIQIKKVVGIYMWLLSEKVKNGENDIQSFYINNHR